MIKNLIKKFVVYSTTPPNNNIARANNFNIIRFAAAIMVMYGHMSVIMGAPVFIVYNQAVSSIAVKIFFIISGYLITKSFMSDSNFLRYMVKRVFRIVPGLIGVVAFAVFIVGPVLTTLPIKEYFLNHSTIFYFKNILFHPVYSLPGVLEDATYPYAINGSIWSLSVEFAMYLILPLVVVVFKKLKILEKGVLFTSIAFLILDVVRYLFFLDKRLVIWGNNLPDWLPLIPFFFIGSYMSFDRFKKYLNLQLATALLVGGGVISLSYECSQILLFITLPYFVLSLALCEKPLFCGWFKTCDFSYGLYLYGFIVQQVLFGILMPYGLSLNVMTVICFVVTLLLSVVSWYAIEKPMQSLGAFLVKKLSHSKT